MPVSFNSPPRNFFLLGSGGEDAVTNFFYNINKSTLTDGQYSVSDIAYTEVDQQFLLSGSGKDSNTKSFGWFEKRNYSSSGPSAANWSPGTIKFATPNVNTTLNFMKQTLSYGGDIIVGGKTGSVPWIAKYNSSGVEQWMSSSQSGDVQYTSVACKSSNYYACGYSDLAGQDEVAFIEKWDDDGSPLWGKAAARIGGDVVLTSIAANDRGEVVAVGEIDGNQSVGYVVKVDTNTGSILWDLSIDSGEVFSTGLRNPVKLNSVYIDGNDQIYIVGQELTTGGSDGVIFKYTAEGNLIWHKKSPAGEEHIYSEIWSDTEVEQTIVLSHETVAGSPTKKGPTLIKYSKNGDVVFKRRIQSSTNYASTAMGLDGDPSFYYVLFVDEEDNVGTGASKTYNFGKVSASGNGFGAFTYDATNSKTINYVVNSSADRIGRLSDGSVRNDSSDFISYPYSGNKILFDDYATNVAYKKTRHEDKDVFEYSGSPVIRPTDFQEVNLLGDIGIVASTTTGSADIYSDDVSATNGFNQPAVNAFDGSTSTRMEPFDNSVVTYAPSPAISVSTSMRVYTAPTGSIIDSDFKINGRGLGRYIDSGTGWKNITVGPVYSTMLTGSTVKTPEGGFNPPHTNQQSGDRSEGVGGLTFTPTTPISYSSSVEVYDNNNVTSCWFNQTNNSGSSTQHATDAWVTVASGSGTINSMFFQRIDNSNWDAGFVAIRVDGTILEDGVETLNTIELEHRSGAASIELYAVEIDGSILTDGGGLTVVPGSWADQSGKGNNGVVYGVTHNAAGYWEFDGVDDYISGSSTILFGTDTGSIEAWFKTSDTSTPGGSIYAESQPGDNTYWGHLRIDGGKPRFVIDDDSVVPEIEAPVAVSDGNWHHVVVTGDGSNYAMYVDGVSYTPSYANGSGYKWFDDTPGLTTYTIGALERTSIGNYFNGEIGDVRVYLRAISPAQVFQNYNATKSKYINEAHDTSVKLAGGVVVDNSIQLNYDFGNKTTLNRATNLIPYSYMVENSWDEGSGGTLTINAGFAPDGSYTAAKALSSSNDMDLNPKLTWDGVGNGAVTIEPNGTYTFSVWLKASTPEQVGNSFKVRMKRVSGTLFNPENTITLTADWQRYSVSGTVNADNTQLMCYVGGFSGNEALVWGAQLEGGISLNSPVLEPYVQTYGTGITYKDGDDFITNKIYDMGGNEKVTGTPEQLIASYDVVNTSNPPNEKGVYFDGKNSRIYIPVVTSGGNLLQGATGFSSQAFTLEAWVYVLSFTSIDGDADQVIVGLGTTALNGQLSFKNGQLRGRGGTGVFNEWALDPATSSTEQWYHVVCTYGSQRYVNLYKNGSEVATYDKGAGLAPSISDNQTVGIGTYDNADNSFAYAGWMGQVRIYNRTLTAAEVSQNFNATRGKYGV